ncbi:MAG: glycosyl hydrolase-related protein, partial [Ignavibacteriaceae bacterium]
NLVYSFQQARNVKLNADTINVHLNKGKNLFLIKVGNSHINYALAFFEMIKWEWGFYARFLDENNNPLKNISVLIPNKIEQPNFEIISTFFFKKKSAELLQRFDVEITSPFIKTFNGNIKIEFDNKSFQFDLDSISFGLSRHQIFIPEIKNKVEANISLNINNSKIEKKVFLQSQKHYELHLMMLAHTDIGYTNPQPIVKEIHAFTLDDVIEMCKKYTDFYWTIETVWQLEQYEISRSKEQFQKIIDLIKKGRVAVSPLYSNPFTGWVSEEEMIHTLTKAKEYKEKYGIEFNAAVYNDVPGQAWFLPQLLKQSNINFLAEGINEVYNGYSLQQNLPKSFMWEGSDGSKILTYLNEAYNEGKDYGLEGRGNFAVEQRMWKRINKLLQKNYNYDMILLNSAFGDNTIVPINQFLAIEEWNKNYEYPKFICSTVSKFGKEFYDKYSNEVPTIKGDWTSPWDISGQGEADKMKKQRWVQHQLLSAEKLSTLVWLLDSTKSSLSNFVDETYSSLLNFSGHGSGLEYGYGSPADNKITMDFREGYVQHAYLNTEELLERSIYKLSKQDESFEGEGIYVFNTLSWERDVPVEIQFPEIVNQKYEIIDLTNNEVIPSFRDDYKQYFIAKNLPSLGFKKYRLSPIPNEKKSANNLKVSDASIENQFYKIIIDKSLKKIVSIIDKKSNKELIDKSEFDFGEPMVERFQNDEKFSQIKFTNVEYKIIDQSPVKLILSIIRKDEVFGQNDYILWDNIDRVDMEYFVNLNKLKTPEKFEEFGIPFPFDLKNPKSLVEILGGYLDTEKDLLPGKTGDAFSIRQSAAIYNENNSISWASRDNRVIRIRETLNKNKLIIANPINNFPIDWNRNEENAEKTMTFNFSFTNQSKTFDSNFTSEFGWEFNTAPVLRKSWYKKEPPAKSYLTIDNSNIILLTIKPDKDENYLLMRLMNTNPNEKIESKITSQFFDGDEAYSMNFLDEQIENMKVNEGSINVELNPNEIKT